MKIRRPWVIQTLVLLGFWLVRLLLTTVPCKYWPCGRDLRPSAVEPHERFIYAAWHEYLLVPMIHFGHPTFRLLVSQHADGLIVAEMCKHLRMSVVKGSSTRGGIEAVRRLLRNSRHRALGVTPDGPRGPRRKVQPGIIYLAARLGWPIVAVGVGYKNPWRLRSWDRFAIARPGHAAAVLSSDPIVVPPNLDRQGLEMWRLKLEQTMNILTAQAELAAQTGKRPAPLVEPTVVEAPAVAA